MVVDGASRGKNHNKRHSRRARTGSTKTCDKEQKQSKGDVPGTRQTTEVKKEEPSTDTHEIAEHQTERSREEEQNKGDENEDSGRYTEEQRRGSGKRGNITQIAEQNTERKVRRSRTKATTKCRKDG